MFIFCKQEHLFVIPKSVIKRHYFYSKSQLGRLLPEEHLVVAQVRSEKPL